MAQKPQSGYLDQLFKAIGDHLGLNGAAALEATQKPQQQTQTDKPVYSESMLRKQGWSESDLAILRKQGQLKP